MGDCEHRELAAAYVLGALDPDDESWYEAHLATCDACAADAEAFRDPLLVLARTHAPADPPAALRGRILDAVAPRRTRSPVLERLGARRLRVGLAFATAAVALLVVAVLLGRGDGTPSAASLLGGPVAAEVSLTPAGTGRVLLRRDGRAVAEVTLAAAPAGKVYEAWVMRGGDVRRAEPAGLTDGGGTAAVVLTRRARAGDVIGFTLEPDGGSRAPTSEPVAAGRL